MSEPNWISVEERLPEEGRRVLVASTQRLKPELSIEIATMLRVGGRTIFEDDGDADEVDGVVYWMDLPVVPPPTADHINAVAAHRVYCDFIAAAAKGRRATAADRDEADRLWPQLTAAQQAEALKWLERRFSPTVPPFVYTDAFRGGPDSAAAKPPPPGTGDAK